MSTKKKTTKRATSKSAPKKSSARRKTTSSKKSRVEGLVQTNGKSYTQDIETVKRLEELLEVGKTILSERQIKEFLRKTLHQ